MKNEIFKKVWMILRPNYNNQNLLSVGIVGTGFFISKNRFISAYHCVNKNIFTPNKKYNNKNILLLSFSGESININKNQVEFHPEIDITFIKTNSSYFYFKSKIKTQINDEVFNIGYPSNCILSILNSTPLKIKAVQVYIGNVKKIIYDYEIKSNDVNLKNKEVLVLNYSVDIGFSGGPLLMRNKVVGMMSHINPKTKTAVAISSKYFFQLSI